MQFSQAAHSQYGEDATSSCPFSPEGPREISHKGSLSSDSAALPSSTAGFLNLFSGQSYLTEEGAPLLWLVSLGPTPVKWQLL